MNEAFDPDGVEQAVFVAGVLYETLDEPWHARRRARLIHVSGAVISDALVRALLAAVAGIPVDSAFDEPAARGPPPAARRLPRASAA